MNRKELEELLCVKINLEYGRFRAEIFEKAKEEMFGRSYEITCIIIIYEILMELSQEFGTEQIKMLLFFPELLTFLYGKWLKQEDSYEEELKSCIEQQILEIGGLQKQNVGKEQGIA